MCTRFRSLACARYTSKDTFSVCVCKRQRKREAAMKKGGTCFYVPIPRIDPRSLPGVMIDEIHLSVVVPGDIPPFRKRYLPIPSPWHISLRSKSIQNLSLSPRGRQTHICARADTRASRAAYTPRSLVG